ncbi:MAG: hypothetical protein QOK15_3340, partial [Nocardioidaceae bacterium]|nr:hypothetical protein [Nocardioidaceae bacterium]
MAGPPGHPRRAWPGAVASGCDALLDLTVVLLATWTIVYHVALLLSLDVVSATLIELQVLVVTTLVWAWPRFRGGGAPARPGSSTAAGAPAATAEDTAVSTAGYDTSSSRERSGRAWAVVTVAAAAVSATAMAVDAPWVLVWTSWLAAAVAGTWWAVRRAAVSDVLRVLGTRDGA